MELTIYYFKRLPQGLKSSPPIAQAFVDQAYQSHPHARGFLDDVTTFSKTRNQMLYEDLPLTLAIASRYRILFKREKADLMKPSARVLGYQISEGSHLGFSSEKIEKINSLTFPCDKKELISRLAFFNFFNHACPRLSELLAPLRRLAKKNVRFKTTESDRESFEQAKKYLLHPELGAIRTPSADLNHPVCIFTDASATAYSAVVTQCLPPTSKEKSQDQSSKQADSAEHKLYIVGCWSGVVTDTMINFPIYLKELYALAQTFVKFKWFLSFRETIVCTDSQTIQWWNNLELVSDDVARRLMYIQRFNYKLIYIPSCVNPADTFTRLCKTKRQGIYERFAHDRVFNANGERIDPAQLFSDEKRKASEAFFKQRRQALSKPVERVPKTVLDSSGDAADDGTLVISSSTTNTTGPSVRKFVDKIEKSLEPCKSSILNGTLCRQQRRIS